MSETIATLERVRAAYSELVARGEKVSSNNVLRITGGSKKTVLKHLDAVRSEVAAAAELDAQPAMGLLRDMADPFIKRLWTEARAQADIESKLHIRALIELQNGLIEDIRQLRQDEERMHARVVEAERRVQERTGIDEQLSALRTMLQELHEDKAEASPDGVDDAMDQEPLPSKVKLTSGLEVAEKLQKMRAGGIRRP